MSKSRKVEYKNSMDTEAAIKHHLRWMPFFVPALLFACSVNTQPAVPETPETTTTVEQITVRDRVTVTGNIAPYRQRNLGFSSNGRIAEIETAEGRRVSRGTPLARLETARVEYSIMAKRYELDSAVGTQAARKVALIQRELEVLEQELRDKYISAPFDGTVALINKREGEIAYVSNETSLIVFIDDSMLKAKVAVDELDIARIKIGQDVVFTFDALPDEEFTGTVSKIAQMGRINKKGLPVVDVELLIENPDPRIIIPYSFKAEIIVTDPVEYTVMDEKAVIWRDDKVYATVKDPANPESNTERPIRIRPWRNGKVIILEGLTVGETVVIPKAAVEPDQGAFGF